MQRSPGKKLLLLVGLVAIAAVGIGVWRHQAGGKTPAEVPGRAANAGVPVTTAVASQGEIDLSLKVIGRAEAYSTVNVRSRVNGQLQSLAFTPGSHVKKGDLLAQVDQRPLKAAYDEAMGNVARDQAQLVKAEADLARYENMLGKGFVSRADYDLYKANLGVARAALESDRAAARAAQTQLDFTTIVAPFDGVTGAPLAYPGATLSADTTDIVVLNQVDPIRVAFAIPEDSLAAVRQSVRRGTLPVMAKIPGDEGEPLQGELEFIDNAVDATTGTIVLKGRFANRDGRLTPGQFAEVTLPTTRLFDAISIPVVALQSSSTGTFVFVVKPDSTVEQRSITTGATTADRVVVDKGLQAGERVVTEGQMLLVDGARVRIDKG
ncbi:efflux RND transporter periplasmic adaptor subunit [Luteibacter sp. UNCMF366Tsu5.1]|uniref:efflux RND transporter periplasmic adaptor subunit n=1 Tax=Luteibacter sp. UNCMF366Tsu5.1 TaxID=1502758 RepID=UPI000908DF19|nr:efflux RND transporter periplasmic adaptor subunit [Luteibacter sp. UNCMF366Tsu5.1]SFW73727.1 membrane fusion protein, multidrug efflux system [Luteibacter sp. UNCMF366Tsu5.1]